MLYQDIVLTAICIPGRIRAARAQALGLVDAVVTGDLLDGAVAFARAALAQPLPLPVSALPVTPPEPAYWAEQEAAIAKRPKGEIAPLRALAANRKAAEIPFAEAIGFDARPSLPCADPIRRRHCGRCFLPNAPPCALRI